jgi:hypothetical protein
MALCLTAGLTGLNRFIIGSATTEYSFYFNTGNAFFSSFTTAEGVNTATIAGTDGLFVGVRTIADGPFIRRNQVNVGTPTTASRKQTPNEENIILFRTVQATFKMAAASIGKGFNPSQANAYARAIDAAQLARS